MDRLKFNSYRYIESESFHAQGTWAKVQKYQNDGYLVTPQGKGNGNWLIIKPAQAMFEIINGDKIILIDLAQEIKYFYGSNKMTIALFNTFITAEKNDLVGIYFSRPIGYYIEKVEK